MSVNFEIFIFFKYYLKFQHQKFSNKLCDCDKLPLLHWESFMPDWKLAVFERASGAVDLCRSKGSDPEESTSTHTHTHKRQTYIFIASNDYALSFDWGVCVTDLFFNNEFDPAHSYC
ncbi:Uncharacterized protein TPS_04203 [Trichinella pseudospiralis]